MLIINNIAFKSGGECAAVASEENEDIIILMVLTWPKRKKIPVSMDPLDGSSNIFDVNVSVGTIFSIFSAK